MAHSINNYYNKCTVFLNFLISFQRKSDRAKRLADNRSWLAFNKGRTTRPSDENRRVVVSTSPQIVDSGLQAKRRRRKCRHLRTVKGTFNTVRAA